MLRMTNMQEMHNPNWILNIMEKTDIEICPTLKLNFPLQLVLNKLLKKQSSPQIAKLNE